MTEGSRLRETVILFSESEASLGRRTEKYPQAGIRGVFSPDPCLPARAGVWGQRPHEEINRFVSEANSLFIICCSALELSTGCTGESQCC